MKNSLSRFQDCPFCKSIKRHYEELFIPVIIELARDGIYIRMTNEEKYGQVISWDFFEKMIFSSYEKNRNKAFIGKIILYFREIIEDLEKRKTQTIPVTKARCQQH